jgi:hypothetical protein
MACYARALILQACESYFCFKLSRMKKFKSEDLINDLQNDVRQITTAVESMKGMDKIKLSYPLNNGKWTAIQALEHLNIYNRYYLPAIETAIAEAKTTRSAWFNSGTLGNYFTNSMKPSDVFQVKNKMKTGKAYNPPASLNAEQVIAEFQQHQQKLLNLLDTARNSDMNSIRIPISVSKFIRLKLGDTFRFLIAHEQRHLIQARNAIHELGIPTDKFPVLIQTKKTPSLN